jgi:hypothetical protein
MDDLDSVFFEYLPEGLSEIVVVIRNEHEERPRVHPATLGT